MRWQERCSANFVKNTIGSCSARKDAYTTIMRNDDLSIQNERTIARKM